MIRSDEWRAVSCLVMLTAWRAACVPLCCSASEPTAAAARGPADAKIAVEENLAEAANEETAPTVRRVVATSVPPATRSATRVSRYGLTRDDLAAIERSLPDVQRVVPVREIRRQARYGVRVCDVRLAGTVAGFAELHALPAARGRFLTEQDDIQRRNVAVLGSGVTRKLFSGQDPVGKHVRIDRNFFLVVGTIGRQGNRSGTDRAEDTVFVPLATMRSRLGDLEISRRAGTFEIEHFELSRIEIVPQNPNEVQKTAAVVEQVLDSRHEDASYTVTALTED